MSETQQILNILEKLVTGQKSLEKGQKNLEEGQKRLEEGQKAMQADISTLKEDTSSLKEGQKNTNREVLHTKTATEAIIAGLTEIKKSTISDKEVKIRLKNLEEHTGTHNPTEN